MTPKFSIVVPLYNKGPHVKRSLDSVLSQKVQDFEVIVVDGGSDDNGPIIVENFASMDPRIRLVQQEGAGVSCARNQGIHESKSELIAFLDADDEWMPNYLETILRLIKEFPSAGLYATGYKDDFGNVCGDLSKTSELQNLVPKEGLVPNYFQIAKKGYYIFFTSSVAASKKVLLELGGFRVDFWWGEDVDLWGRIALRYPVAYSSQVCSIYYQNVINSACSRKKPVKSHPFVESARDSIVSGDLPACILADLEEYIEYQEVVTAKHNIMCGDKGNALKILIRKNTKLVNRKKLIYLILSTTIKENYHFFKHIFER